MKYAFDSGRWSPAESWRTIRTIRAEPPPAISSKVSRGERKVVFQTALEQAQQQFAAASAVGYESRPLNLFYGLAQAGKALAAASRLLDQSKPEDEFKSWKSGSHGLTFSPQGSEFWRQRVRVDAGKSDSFSRASIALGSARDFESVELGALAAQIPEFSMEWRDFDWWPRCLHSDDAMHGGKDVFDLRDYRGPLELKEIETYVGHYPALAGAVVLLDDDGNPAKRTDGGFPSVTLAAGTVTESGPYRAWPTGARHYGGSRMVMPRPDDSAGDLHPIMAWWLLLFGFSILARYHPKEWTEALAMGSSPIASKIEFLLDAAVSSVPDLLAREWWVSPWAS